MAAQAQKKAIELSDPVQTPPIKTEAVAATGTPAPAGLPADLDGIVHILTCGSVDDGKSTLIGRLLWDAADLPDDTRATLQRSIGADGEPDLSLLVDGLAAEREQGITIDVAWRYFDAEQRRYVIIDSPGHEQYTRNMATGASHADVAIMLIDARHGVKRQTRRHAAILDLVGLRRVIVAVNKMDLVDWDETRFNDIAADIGGVMQRFGFEAVVVLPVAARGGDNVARKSARSPWYQGPTLLDQLGQIPSRGRSFDGEFRMPVQTVLRGGTDFRGLAGTVSSGTVRVGDTIKEVGSDRAAKVHRIATMDGDLDAAGSGQAVVLQLDTDLDIARGAVLASPDAPIGLAREVESRLVWMADAPLDPDHGLLLRTATDLVPVSGINVRAKLDLETLAENPGGVCAANDIAIADIALGRGTALERFSVHRETGSFVLVDALTGSTLAAGVVSAAREHSTADEKTAFRLSHDMLSRGLCQGLDPSSTEYRRRAREVAIILQAAGVTVDMSELE
jgi:bifunctional enzyme CysN/CysC